MRFNINRFIEKLENRISYSVYSKKYTYEIKTSAKKDLIQMGEIDDDNTKTEVYTIHIHDQQKPVGESVVEIYENNMYVSDIYIEKEYRGKNIAKNIIKNFKDFSNGKIYIVSSSEIMSGILKKKEINFEYIENGWYVYG